MLLTSGSRFILQIPTPLETKGFLWCAQQHWKVERTIERYCLQRRFRILGRRERKEWHCGCATHRQSRTARRATNWTALRTIPSGTVRRNQRHIFRLVRPGREFGTQGRRRFGAHVMDLGLEKEAFGTAIAAILEIRIKTELQWSPSNEEGTKWTSGGWRLRHRKRWKPCCRFCSLSPASTVCILSDGRVLGWGFHGFPGTKGARDLTKWSSRGPQA